LGLLVRIGTSQWVTSNPNKKILSDANSRARLWVRHLTRSAAPFLLAAGPLNVRAWFVDWKHITQISVLEKLLRFLSATALTG
jgi:hypothetical protein